MKKFLTASAIGAMLVGGIAMAMQTETSAPQKAPLTKAQMLARADARFAALDVSKDGQLSAEERQAGKQRRGGRGGGRADTNGDGLISRAEHRAAAEARFARRDADGNGTIEASERRGKMRHGRGHGGRRAMMMMADADKDGVITRAEFDAASAQRFMRLDTNKDGKLDTADRPQRRMTPPPAPTPGAG